MAAPTKPDASDNAPASRAETVANLFREHNRALVNYLALRLRSHQEAKEVAQEAYVRLLQLEEPSAASFLKTYLFRVATNIAYDHLRRRGHQQRVEHMQEFDDIDCGIDNPERRLLAGDALRVLSLCLKELPEKHRVAFTLFRMKGHSQKRIAARLGVSERMVRHYINQTLVYCRRRIDGASAHEAKEGLQK